MPKCCGMVSGGTVLLMEEWNVLQTRGLAFFVNVLRDIQRAPRRDGQAEAGGIAFHHIYNSCWVPSAASKHCFTSPSARDHKEHLMQCPYSQSKTRRKIPGGEKKKTRLSARKTNIIHDVLLFVGEKKCHRSLRYRLCLSHQINPRNLSRGTHFIGSCLV